MTTTPTTQLNGSADASDAKPWLSLALRLGLGVAWWVALLLPEISREILMQGSLTDVTWGFVRVVGLVAVACVVFGFVHRHRPGISPLVALICLWVGSLAFAATMPPVTEPLLDNVAVLVFMAPPVFIAEAWFVALPMTAVTAVMVARNNRQRPELLFRA